MNNFIGTGWSFPPTFSNGGKDMDMTTGVEDINNSLHILLSTSLRERVMQPYYGCNLNYLVFDPMSENFKTYLRHLVETAILYHEPRIKAERIDVYDDEEVQGLIKIAITYSIRNTNSIYNFVYPFYVQS